MPIEYRGSLWFDAKLRRTFDRRSGLHAIIERTRRCLLWIHDPENLDLQRVRFSRGIDSNPVQLEP
jgi:hypothetical protein